MAVTIESLRFENAFTYRECSMVLANQGLVYLNGQNGHGKSTPFETLQHILYGTTSRGVRKDGLACAVPGAGGFLGEVVLQNPDGRWLVRQTRNHERYKTSMQVLKWVDDKWSPRWQDGGCPKKMDDAQKLASTLLGLQQHEFSGCMYLAQASAHTLIEGTPGEKMRYIAQLFGLDVCDRMIVWLRDALKQAERDVVDVPVLEARHVELQEQHARYDVPGDTDMAVMNSAMRVGAERKHKLRGTIGRAREALAVARQAERLRQERDQLGETGDLEALKERHAKLLDKRVALMRQQEAATERADIERELAGLPANDTPLAELDAEAERLQNEINRLDGLIAQLLLRDDVQAQFDDLPAARSVADVTDLSDPLGERKHVLEANVQAKRQEAERLRETIASCRTGTCPTCHRDLDVHQMEQLAGEATDAADTLDAERADVTEQLDRLLEEGRVAGQKAKLSEKLSGLPEGDVLAAQELLGAAHTRYQGVRVGRAAAVDRAALQGRLDALPDAPEHVGAKLARVEALAAGVLAEAERAAERLRLDRQLAGVTGAGAGAAEELAERADAELDRVDAAVAAVQERVVRARVARDDYDALTRELDEAAAELDRLAEPRRRVHVLTYSVAAVQRLKRRKLHEVVGSVRDCLPRFASTMFSHEPNTRFVVSGDDDSLDLVCRRRVDGSVVDIPVKSLSGGEKQRLSVALVFTLHALLHARKRPDLLILDEVDRGLDDVGIASLMSLVRSVRQQYGTVIMTSHRSQIAGAAFDRTWTVSKQDETSCLFTDGSRTC